MKTIDEFIDNLNPGEVFTFKDLVNKCGANSPSEAATLIEDLLNYKCSDRKHELITEWVSTERIYRKKILPEDRFIKKIMREAKGNKAVKSLVDIWLNNVPCKTVFTTYEVASIFRMPNRLNSFKKCFLDAINAGLMVAKNLNGIIFYQKTGLSLKVNPNYNEIQALFAEFLIKKGLTDKYAEVIGDRSIDDILTGVDELRPVLPIKWISGAIDFGSTKEGFGYWNEIHKDWMEEIILYYKPDYDSTINDIRNSLDTIAATTLREIAQELLCLNGWYENDNEGKPKWTILSK